jgi:tight adherence protein C
VDVAHHEVGAMSLAAMAVVVVILVGSLVAWRTRPHAAARIDMALVSRTTGFEKARLTFRQWTGSTARRGLCVATGAVLVAVGLWPLVFVVGPVLASLPWLVEQRSRRARSARVSRELPDVVDLVVLAAGAGYSVAQTVDAVGRTSSGVVAERLARASVEFRSGRPLVEALDAIRDLDPLMAGLADALVASLRHGVALTDALRVPAAELRAERRRAGEVAARRVPVKLLFPLVFCVLPAFGLLTVMPLLLASLEAVRRGS